MNGAKESVGKINVRLWTVNGHANVSNVSANSNK